MQQWNVVVTVHDFKHACDMLGAFGRVKRTDFYNTLVMQVDDAQQMLETLHNRSLEDHDFLKPISRLIPVTSTFTFQSPDEFENKAREAIMAWVSELAGKGFHVRMHRRGLKGRLSGHEEERMLDDILLEALGEAGTPGHISFEDPDAVIAVETVSTWAGLSLWSREQLQKYPFIRID
jgi:tRNA(Ser,Leu) C12 N-acetylase TAN1